MKELVFLLEEESASAMLNGLLPRLLDPRVQPRLMVFEGKQDLERQMVKRLRGYVNPQARFIVLRDQDSTPDCKVVKARLRGLHLRAMLVAAGWTCLHRHAAVPEEHQADGGQHQ